MKMIKDAETTPRGKLHKIPRLFACFMGNPFYRQANSVDDHSTVAKAEHNQRDS